MRRMLAALNWLQIDHGSCPSSLSIAALWTIGVGAAIGGDFFGWQYVLYGMVGFCWFTAHCLRCCIIQES